MTTTPVMTDIVQQHFVHFLSPGTFVSEETVKPVDGWTVETAAEMAHGVLERHNATPYGFYFTTRSRGPDDLDSRQTARSPMYWLGGRIETRAEVEARDDPKESILRSNMRINEIERVIINDNSWRFTSALGPTDVVLDWKPCPVPAVEP